MNPNENQIDAPAPDQAAPVKRKYKKRKKTKTKKKPEIRLNPKHMAFVQEYIRTDNAVKSYMKVYPRSSYGAAGVSSHDLLKNPKISAFLRNYYDNLWEKNEEQIGRSFNRLLKIIESDIADVVEYENDSMSIRNFKEVDTSVIQEIRHSSSPTKYGVAENKSVKLFDKTKLMPELFRMLGMIKDKMEHSGVIKIIPPDELPDDSEPDEEPIEENGTQGN